MQVMLKKAGAQWRPLHNQPEIQPSGSVWHHRLPALESFVCESIGSHVFSTPRLALAVGMFLGALAKVP
jgi:hypothetical protein